MEFNLIRKAKLAFSEQARKEQEAWEKLVTAAVNDPGRLENRDKLTAKVKAAIYNPRDIRNLDVRFCEQNESKSQRDKIVGYGLVVSEGEDLLMYTSVFVDWINASPRIRSFHTELGPRLNKQGIDKDSLLDLVRESARQKTSGDEYQQAEPVFLKPRPRKFS